MSIQSEHMRNLTQQLVREVPLAVYDLEGYVLVRGTSTESEHNLRSACDTILPSGTWRARRLHF